MPSPKVALRDLARCIEIARANVDGAVREYDEIFERAEQQLAYAYAALAVSDYDGDMDGVRI